jgi:hypothetical protein
MTEPRRADAGGKRPGPASQQPTQSTLAEPTGELPAGNVEMMRL